MEKQPILGNKGGRQQPRTPVEAPDSLQSTSYTKILLALGEGEFAGELDGRRIFLDNTPLIGADGSPNFEGVKWEFRPGTPHQAYIPGMPAIENARTVSAELVSSWVTTVTNTQLSAARLRLSWPQLQRQKDNGDTVGYRIEYAIDLATDGGAFKEILKTAVDGKTTTKYERSHRLDLPTAYSGWQVRLRRLTPKQNSNRIADAMMVEAITEVIDAKLSYPETALLFVQFDAKQFRNIPQITCEPKMRIIRVPANYHPDSRRYYGSWDGTFKWAWSDNPAWVLYDLIINDRFSIGTRVKAENLTLAKWDLYTIAQYCDQMVSDGEGGEEPRFTCNVYIQSQEDAWAVLRDIAGIFRGMTFWANNNMNVLADIRIDSDYSINQGIITTTLQVTWDAASSAVAYDVEWRKDNGNWITAPQTTARRLEVPNVDEGRYQARVRAMNAAAISSIWTTTRDTLLERHTRPPSEPQFLQTTPLLFGIRLDWAFVKSTNVLLKTEIGYNKSGEEDDTLQFADIAYPQRTYTLQGLAAGEKFYFRARLVDKSGHASAWTSLVSGHASTDTRWIVEASRDHFLDAKTGRRLQEQLAEQARVDARYKQSAAENAQAIERLQDMLKDLQQRTR